MSPIRLPVGVQHKQQRHPHHRSSGLLAYRLAIYDCLFLGLSLLLWSGPSSATDSSFYPGLVGDSRRNQSCPAPTAFIFSWWRRTSFSTTTTASPIETSSLSSWAPDQPSTPPPSWSTPPFSHRDSLHHRTTSSASPTSSSSSSTTVMRAWNCHGRNQRELVERLRQAAIVSSPAVEAVLCQTDRQDYVPQNPYQDAPQAIGLGQTISAPHMHAHVLEEILPYVQLKGPAASSSDSSSSNNNNNNQDLAKNMEPVKILDVGCGSGYLTACLGRWFQARPTPEQPHPVAGGPGSILGRPGQVFGIDIHEHLVNLAATNLARHDADLLRTKTVVLQQANGWEGWPAQAPFDAIHVGAAAAHFPQALAVQLKVGGVLIVPVGPSGEAQALYKVERKTAQQPGTFVPADYQVTELLGVRYVPLVQEPHSRPLP